jgi:KGK domain
MNSNLEVLNDDDVISVINISQRELTIGNSNICDEGIECEVLRHDTEHKGWRKGKIKFVIQFEPDKPEKTNHNEHQNGNSLDDIRQTIAEQCPKHHE